MFLRSTTASIICTICGQDSSVIAVGLDTPTSTTRRFRPLPAEVVTGISTCLPASADSIEIPDSFPVIHVQAFSPVDRPTMPSADFCLPILSPLDDSSPPVRACCPNNQSGVICYILVLTFLFIYYNGTINQLHGGIYHDGETKSIRAQAILSRRLT
jgi:hypothetical protein